MYVMVAMCLISVEYLSYAFLSLSLLLQRIDLELKGCVRLFRFNI